MKTQIRYKTFETNSSSQHTLTLMLKEDYLKQEREANKKRYDPNWFWDTWGNEWISKDDIVQQGRENSWFKKDYESGRWGNSKVFVDLSDDEIFNLYANKFQCDRFMETDDDVGESIVKELETPSGEVVVAISQYIAEG